MQTSRKRYSRSDAASRYNLCEIKIYEQKEGYQKMEHNFSREQLEKRLEEVKKQLGETGKAERIELDNDMEEQAIEMEQHEVSVTMEQNLRKEMTMIEDALAQMDEQEK